MIQKFYALVRTILVEGATISNLKFGCQVTEKDGVLRMTNGIVTRTFLTSPGFVTIDLYSHERNSSVLRAVDPEVLSFC